MSKIISESQFLDNNFSVNPNRPLIFLKMVGIGPETLKLDKNEIAQKISECPGFYLEFDDLRSELHAYIDRMVDLYE